MTFVTLLCMQLALASVANMLPFCYLAEQLHLQLLYTNKMLNLEDECVKKQSHFKFSPKDGIGFKLEKRNCVWFVAFVPAAKLLPPMRERERRFRGWWWRSRLFQVLLLVLGLLTDWLISQH